MCLYFFLGVMFSIECKLDAPRSRSTSKTLFPSFARQIAMFAEKRDLPTPPLPLATGIIIKLYSAVFTFALIIAKITTLNIR